MRKKHNKKQTQEEENKEELEQEQNSNEESVEEENNQEDEKDQKIDELEKELEKYKQIASNTQNQYLTLKNDFDAFKRKTEEQKDQQKIDNFVDAISNIIPLIEDLRSTVENMPEDLAEDNRAKGVKMIYESMIKKLNSMWVYQIESVWLAPDEQYHEPIGKEQVEEDNKGKIVKEFQKGYYYDTWEEKKVIQVAKVVIGE